MSDTKSPNGFCTRVLATGFIIKISIYNVYIEDKKFNYMNLLSHKKIWVS